MIRPLSTIACLLAIAGLVRAADPNPHEIPRAAADVLNGATEFELLSLEPGLPCKPDVGFHGYPILGKSTIQGGDAKKLVAAFAKAVADEDVLPKQCFEPRHGIRATLDGKTVEFVICFTCSNVYVYTQDETDANKLKRLTSLVIGKEPLKAFNDALTAAKVPLPEQAK